MTDGLRGPALLSGPALLFCPADRPDRFAKAAAAADCVILDLEDAVSPEHKAVARAAVVDALAELDRDPSDRDLSDRDPGAGGRGVGVLVRVNAVGTPWHADDLAALAGHPDVVVMLPKATRREDVEALAPRPVVALCETAAGVLAAADIARATNCVALMFGGEDLVADLGGRPGRSPSGGLRPAVQQSRTAVLLAARAAGRYAIDTPFVDIPDLETLSADAEDAAAAGFSAKACIHPTQVAVVRAAFAPTEAELIWARGVLEAAVGADAVFRYEGRMVDAPVLAHARGIIAAGPAKTT